MKHHQPLSNDQQQPTNNLQQWDLIIKIAAAKGWRSQRRAFACNASNMEGVCVLSGVASTSASLTAGALFEAMIAAATIASYHGFQHILFLTARRNVAQVFKKEKATDWLDIIGVANLNFLILQGLICKVFLCASCSG